VNEFLQEETEETENHCLTRMKTSNLREF